MKSPTVFVWGLALFVIGVAALVFTPWRRGESRPGSRPWAERRWADSGSPRPDIIALRILDREGESLLDVRGVEMRSDDRGIAYLRPATAGQVDIILTTADGRRWRAQWQEVEP